MIEMGFLGLAVSLRVRKCTGSSALARTTVLVLPPLIWGWLTYRVMVYDALSDHATHEERLAIMRRHRTPLLVIGIVSGYLGAAPSLIWAMGALALPMMPLLIPVRTPSTSLKYSPRSPPAPWPGVGGEAGRLMLVVGIVE